MKSKYQFLNVNGRADFSKSVILGVVISTIAGSAQAQVAEWGGVDNADWTNGVNWSTPGAPLSGTTVRIADPGSNPFPELDGVDGEAGTLYIGSLNGSNLQLLGGGTLTTGKAIVGNNTNNNDPTNQLDEQSASASIMDSNSAWTTDTLTLGYYGSGTINLTDGASFVANDTSSLATFEQSSATVDVASGSTFDLGSNGTIIGGAGDATITVANGSKIMSGAATIGEQATSVSEVTLVGDGSEWTIEGGDLRIGRDGEGALDIRQGGAAYANGRIFVADKTDSTGSLVIDGEGSLLDSGSYVALGNQGEAVGKVLNGGALEATEIITGWESGSDSDLLVSGENSQVNASNYFMVGLSGTASATLTDGGSVNEIAGASNVSVRVAFGSDSTGTLNIGAAEGEDAAAPGVITVDTLAFGGGTGDLVFNHTDENYLFAPAVISDGAGTHAIDHLSGTTLFTGDSSGFDGTTTVSGGRLLVGDASGSGMLGGIVDVSTGAVLGGSGTVGEVDVASGGTLSPGSSIGEMTVNGDLAFSNDSFFDIEVKPDGSNGDHVFVTGKATLNGTVRHIGLEGDYARDSIHTILTAEGGLDGEFDAVESGYTFLDTELAYTGKEVGLRLTRNDLDFVDLGDSDNVEHTGRAIEDLKAGDPLFDEFVKHMSGNDDAKEILEQLSGDSHASSQTAMGQSTRMVGSLVRSHSRARIMGGASGETQLSRSPRENQYASLGATSSGRTSQDLGTQEALNSRAWGRAFGTWGRNDGDGNAPGNDYLTGGFLFGLDTEIDGWTLGGFGGYSRSDIDSERDGAGSDVDSYHAGIYGGRQFDVGGPGVLGLNAGGSFSWHETEARRRVNMPGGTQHLSSDYSARSYQIFSELGYRMEGEQGALEPYAGFSYLRQHTQAHEEEGGSAALIRESSTRNTYYSTLGLRGETSFDLDDDRALTLRGGLGWRHAFGDVTPTVEQRFAGGESFSISGAPIDRDAAILETGLDFDLSETTTLSLDYDGQLSPNAQEHTGRLELSVRF